MKETEEDQNKWKDVSCSWIEESIIQMTTIPQIICRFKAILLNISPAFLLYIDKLILKVKWKWKWPRIDNFEKQQSWRIHIFQSDTNNVRHNNQDSVVLANDRYLDQAEKAKLGKLGSMKIV